MKNNVFLAGILSLALVFGMTVIGCDNDSTGDGNNNNNSPFEGKWKYTSMPAEYGVAYIVFSGNTFKYQLEGQISQMAAALSGTFTSTDTEITFTATAPSKKWKQGYTLSGADMKLKEGTEIPENFNDFFVGDFKRQ
jgi:uncharacterized lipoprotein NlpE involved in copper resistance